MSYLTSLRLCCLLLATLPSGAAFAEEINLPYQGLTLNANLSVAPGRSLSDGVVLITHGSQAHSRLELIEGLQERLLEHGRNSLAISLSLGIDNRHGLWDCSVPSQYRHEDAIGEIGAWVEWLESRGANDIILMAHSRGGSQSLQYATEQDSAIIKSLVLRHLVFPTRSEPTQSTANASTGTCCPCWNMLEPWSRKGGVTLCSRESRFWSSARRRR